MIGEVVVIGRNTSWSDPKVRFYHVDSPKEFVSGIHCKITQLDENKFQIIEFHNGNDGEPTVNGTYVNGLAITKSNVNSDSRINLGGEVDLDIKKIFGIIPVVNKVKINSDDFTIEFLSLEQVYNEFINRQNKIELKHATISNIWKAFTAGIPAIGFIIYETLPGHHTIDTGISGVASALSTLTLGSMSTAFSSQTQKKEQMSEVVIDLENLYHCPKCKKNFKLEDPKHSYKNLKKRGKCVYEGCKAIFVPEKL